MSSNMTHDGVEIDYVIVETLIVTAPKTLQHFCIKYTFNTRSIQCQQSKGLKVKSYTECLLNTTAIAVDAQFKRLYCAHGNSLAQWQT